MKKYLHALNLITQNSYRSIKRLWHYFHNWEYVWHKATLSELIQAGIAQTVVEKLLKSRRNFDVDGAMEALENANIKIIGRDSEEFLNALRHIPNAPFLLYRRGEPLHQNKNFIAVVGTRKPSEYGQKITGEIAEKFAQNDWIVVSGLAFGIDAIAHRMAVKQGKPTIAVLASGVDIISPGYHERLGQEILVNGGTLLSEYVPGSPVADYRFLERNRIISGLSKATLIIEAREKSGALITARHALEQNRDVYALVGDIYRPQAQGCLRLIAENAAYPIVSFEALYQEFGFQRGKIKPTFSDPLLSAIVKTLQEEACSTEKLASLLSVLPSNITVALTQLELLGLIKRDSQNRWCLSKI